MAIGIISDTHDNLSNLIYCLEYLREQNVDTIIHCGDLTDPDMISHFHGFRLIYTFGNCDHANRSIRRKIMKLDKNNFAGLSYEGKLEGKSIFAVHGNVKGQIMDLVRSKSFDYVFSGHTHKRRDETRLTTRLINPGALGGLKLERRSFCILDLLSGDLQVIKVTE